MSARFIAPFLAVLLIAPLTSCATSGEPSRRVSGDVVTMEDLAGLENLTVFQALQQVKPMWVRSPRFSRMRVYLDGIYVGLRSSLRNMRVQNIAEIRHLDRREATTEFGTGHGEGALIVRSQR